MTPATARSHRRATVRAPASRRVSGPVRRPVVLPGGVPTPVPAPRRDRSSILTRVRALPDRRLLDRLLRGRIWIWAVGLMLGGIVAMQVSLLKLNSGISRAVETTATLERQNGELEAAIARLSNTARVQEGAARRGMLMPAAGDVSYLTSGPRDAARAVQRMQPPSDAAHALLANGGILPGTVVPAASAADLAGAAEPQPDAGLPAETPSPDGTALATAGQG